MNVRVTASTIQVHEPSYTLHTLFQMLIKLVSLLDLIKNMEKRPFLDRC